jgi:hypothetical protein
LLINFIKFVCVFVSKECNRGVLRACILLFVYKLPPTLISNFYERSAILVYELRDRSSRNALLGKRGTFRELLRWLAERP